LHQPNHSSSPDIDPQSAQNELHRGLGLPTALAIGVGTMIAAGIFTLSGLAVKEVGSAAIISFLLAALVASFTALTYCEFASIYPRSGEGYLYARETFRPTLAWFVGFCLLLGYSASTAFYLASLSIYWQEFIYSTPWVTTAGFVSLALLTGLNIRGSKESGAFQVVVTLFKVILLIWFVMGGLPDVNLEVLRARFSTDILAIGSTGAMVFITFFGFSAIAASAGEIKDPVKTIPRAIFWSMGIVTVLYTLVVIVVLTAELNTYGEAAMGLTAERFLGPIGLKVIVGGAIFSMISASNASIMAGSRVAMAMAQRGHLPNVLGQVNAETKTPIKAILTVGLMIGVFILTIGTQTERFEDALKVQHTHEMSRLSLSHAPIEESVLVILDGAALSTTEWSYHSEANVLSVNPKRLGTSAQMKGALVQVQYRVYRGVEQLAYYADTVLLLVLVVVNAGLIIHRRRYPDLERPFKVPLVPLLPGLGIIANLYLITQFIHHYESVVLAVSTLLIGWLCFMIWRRVAQGEMAQSV
jgi:basic amino acid/polyamine antiporter, APA family